MSSELDQIFEESDLEKTSGLDRWFKEKWVDISRKDKSGKYAPCGRSDSGKGKYPKCRPSKRITKETPVTTRQLTEKEERSAIRKKRKIEREKASKPAGGMARKPKMAPTIKNSSRVNRVIGLYKIAMMDEVNSKYITSFDFDQTIRKVNGELNAFILPKIKEANSKGDVYLVTSRADNKDNLDFVINFLKEKELDGRSLFSYFKGFYFVGGLKANKLKELGVKVHYDDNDLEIDLADEKGIEAIKV